MLRPKQLGPICQSARSFFLSGSRSGNADGTCESTTCSEDEPNVISRQKPKNTVAPFPPKTESSKTAVHSSAAAAGKVATCVATSEPHILVSAPSNSSSLLRSEENGINNGDNFCDNDTRKNVSNYCYSSSSMSVAENLTKAGLATVGFLSDLVNYRVPTSLDGNIFVPHNCVVESDGAPLSNGFSRSSKGSKSPTTKAANFLPQTQRAKLSTGSVSKGSNSTTFHSHEKAPPGGTIATKGPKCVVPPVTSRSRESSVECHRTVVPLELQDKRQWSKLPPRGAKTRSIVVAHANSKSCSSWVPLERRAVVAGMAEGTSSLVVQQPSPVGGGRKHIHASLLSVTTSPLLSSANAATGRAVERIYHCLRRQPKWGPAAEAALWNLNCYTLDAYLANQVLKLLQDHSVALGFFYWLKHEVAGYKHDAHCYTTMVGILGRARQFGAIKRLLDEMVRDGCTPNVVTYNRLIHSYGRANYLAQAVDIFHQMQVAGCEPDRVTYCTLIDIHAKAGFLEVAMGMYRRMQEAGLSPDTFTYSAMINCLGKAGHLSAAYNLFSEMITRGCIPNLVTYNIMIALHAKARQYPTVLKLYQDMQTAGFRPDRVTYNIVMEVLGHCGYLDEVEAMFVEMKQEDWVPDEPLYGLLVDLWGKAGNVDKACGWYQSMLDAGLHPNVPTCNSLLSSFLRAYRIADARDLLLTMLRLGLQPSLQTYTLLLSCCTEMLAHHHEGQGKFVGAWCELMSITGHPAHMFLLSMPAAGSDGQNVRDHASNFLDLMHSEDRESKRGLVDAIVDFFHKSGMKEEAGLIWEAASQRNVYPDVLMRKSLRPSYWVINLHVMSEGTAVTALSRTLAWFRRGMLASRVGPDRIDIVTGWGRRSRVTGSSLVRQSVQELLHLFGSPFSTERGNTGCFVGCGEPLTNWLLHSHVERLHLL